MVVMLLMNFSVLISCEHIILSIFPADERYKKLELPVHELLASLAFFFDKSSHDLSNMSPHYLFAVSCTVPSKLSSNYHGPQLLSRISC